MPHAQTPPTLAYFWHLAKCARLAGHCLDLRGGVYTLLREVMRRKDVAATSGEI
ncbi:MAG: hypothetical protein U5N55_04670 [Cypionkella sp.]|nr:hypothetical protein [Cypionkella sp.]